MNIRFNNGNKLNKFHRQVPPCAKENNLTLNINKTKEMIVDFRKQQREHPPIHIDGTVMEKVES